MSLIGKILRFISKSFLTMAFLFFVVSAGALSAFLVFQNVFNVSDTIVPLVVGEELKIAQEKLKAQPTETDN